MATLSPERAAALVGRPGRFAFVPGSRPDGVAGYWQGEAEGPPGCLRIVAFDTSEDDEGLDVVATQVVEGVNDLGSVRSSGQLSSSRWGRRREGVALTPPGLPPVT